MPEKKARSGSEKRRRQPHIDFRVTAKEKAEIEKAAERAGLDVGSFARVQCLAAPKVRAARRPVVEMKALARLLGEMGKIGSNLNQLARMANTEKCVETDGLESTLAKVRIVAGEIMQAMGRKYPGGGDKGRQTVLVAEDPTRM